MKDNKHAYIFCAIIIFDKKSDLGVRLDYIRSNGIIIIFWGHYAKRT